MCEACSNRTESMGPVRSVAMRPYVWLYVWHTKSAVGSLGDTCAWGVRRALGTKAHYRHVTKATNSGRSEFATSRHTLSSYRETSLHGSHSPAIPPEATEDVYGLSVIPLSL